MRLLFLAVAAVMISCNSGLSDKDMGRIRTGLMLHNESARMRHFEDSLAQALEIHTVLAGTHTPEERERKVAESMDRIESSADTLRGFKDRWDITYDEYMKYCEDHNLDPKEYYKELQNHDEKANSEKKKLKF